MMKRLLAVIVPSVFAAGVSATDWYGDVTDGNSDLSNQRGSAENFSGVQQSIGDSVPTLNSFA